MVAAPIVPRSLDEPVARSDARSKVQRIIDADRAECERAVIGGGERELARILAQSEAELRQRLAQLRASGRGDSWTAADVEASLVQVQAALAQVQPRLVGVLANGAEKAHALGSKSVTNVLEHFERLTAGSVRPLAVRAALALEHTRLARYESSVQRYGMHTIGVISRQLQAGILTGQTFDEMTRRLAGTRGEAGMLVQNRGWANRIVRTESMAAYAEGAQQEIIAQKAKRWPTLKRKLIETWDRRTSWDSREAHGQVRDTHELFHDGMNRQYLTPPGRPNDRAVLIPWRNEWEADDPTQEWERERTPEEVERDTVPARPQPTEL